LKREKVLRGIAHIACRHHKLVLLTAVILTVLAILPIGRGMHKSFDVSKMLPQDIPAAQAFTRAITDFGSADDAVVVFKLHEQTSEAVEAAGKVADGAVKTLLENPNVESAFCRMFTDEERDYFLKTVLPHRGLLLLDDEHLDAVKKKLEPDQIEKSVRRTARKLKGTVTSGKTSELAALNVVGLASIFEEGLKEIIGSSDDKISNSGYLVDKNRTMMLIIIQPRKPAQDVIFSETVMADIAAAVDAELEKTPEAAKKLFYVEYGGGYEIAKTYDHKVNSTLMGTVTTSVIAVILLFGYFFRRYGVLFYIGIPLVMIVAWTAGLGWLIFGQLNIVSCGFAAVLVGLGVDYAVHIYNRYVEERSTGENVYDSFSASLAHTGWGVIIGMVTTCFAFLALNAAEFSQLAEFGFLAGMGIAMSVPGMLFILPALIAWRNSYKPENIRVLRPTTFFLPELAGFMEKHRRKSFGITLLITFACGGVLLLRPEPIHFDPSLDSLRPQERVFELNGEIARAFSNRNPNKLYLLAYGESEEEALDEAARLVKGCKKLVENGDLEGYNSPMQYLPAPSMQKSRLEQLRSIDFDEALTTLRESIASQGLQEEAFSFTIDLLKQHQELLKTGGVVLATDFDGTPIWRFLKRLVAPHRERYDLKFAFPPESAFPLELAEDAKNRDDEVVAKAGDVLSQDDVRKLIDPALPHMKQVRRILVKARGWTVKTNIYLPTMKSSKVGALKIDSEWMQRVRQTLELKEKADVNAPGVGAYITGVSILTHELADVVKADFWNISVWVFLISMCVLACFYWRHPVRVVYCALPVSLGLLVLFGVMSAFHIDFNFVNILSVPIIIGLGIDNGIHLVNRFFEGDRKIRPMIVDTGRALMITSLTSMAGFGSLAISGYEGITSMGILCVLALATTLFSSLFMMPAIVSTFSPVEEKPKSHESDQD